MSWSSAERAGTPLRNLADIFDFVMTLRFLFLLLEAAESAPFGDDVGGSLSARIRRADDDARRRSEVPARSPVRLSPS